MTSPVRTSGSPWRNTTARLVTAALAAGALTVYVPSALADAPVYDCGFDTVRQDQVTGQVFEGTAWGYVVHAEGGEVTIRCYITVNGTEVASTPTGTAMATSAGSLASTRLGASTGVATTAGLVSFAAEDTDHVQICAEVGSSHGSAGECFDSVETQVPPQPILDLAEQLLDALETTNGPLTCGLLALLAPGIPPVEIVPPDPDVYVFGFLLVDCPPYEGEEAPIDDKKAKHRGRRPRR